MANTIICPNCGEHVITDGKFCPRCGQPLVTGVQNSFQQAPAVSVQQKAKRNYYLMLANIFGIIDVVYYFVNQGTQSVNSFADIIANSIVGPMLSTRYILVLVAVICGFIAWILRNQWVTLATAIIYTLSAAFYLYQISSILPYAGFDAIDIILIICDVLFPVWWTFTAFYQMRTRGY